MITDDMAPVIAGTSFPLREYEKAHDQRGNADRYPGGGGFRRSRGFADSFAADRGLEAEPGRLQRPGQTDDAGAGRPALAVPGLESAAGRSAPVRRASPVEPSASLHAVAAL